MDLQIIDSKKKDKPDIFFNPNKIDNRESIENIKNFIFSFEAKNPEEVDDFLSQTNETSLALFRRNDDFIEDYIQTKEMSCDDKMKDLDYMINYFLVDERYEDCALLQNIKERTIDHYENLSIKDLLS